MLDDQFLTRRPWDVPGAVAGTREEAVFSDRGGFNTRRIHVRAATVDEAAMSVEAVLATERPVRVFDWQQGRVLEEVLLIGGAQFPEQIPLLDHHRHFSLETVLGSIRQLRRTAGELIGRLFFVRDDDDAARVWNKVRQGHLTDVSVGYTFFARDTVEIPAGGSETIEGREFRASEVPLRIVKRWRAAEGSVVAIGADEASKMRCNFQLVYTKGGRMPDKVKPGQIGGGFATYARSSAPLPKRIDGSDNPNYPGRPHVEVSEPGIMQEARVAGTAWAREHGYVPRTDKERNDSEPYLGAGLRAMAAYCLERETGVDRYTWERAADLFSRAISTGSFPELTSTAATKTLSAGYGETESTAAQWAGEREVSDFKPWKDIELGAAPDLKEVGKAGELESSALKEKAEPFQLSTYGRTFTLDRKTFINDDLGGFLRAPQKLGAAAKRNIDDLMYTLMISGTGSNGPTLTEDSKQVFATDHTVNGENESFTVANFLDGSPGSVLSSAGLSAGKKLFRKFRGVQAELINVRPRVILVPSDLEQTALELVESSQIIIAGNTDVTRGSANVHSGTLRVIVEPRLDEATDGTTAWYLIANPMDVDSFVIVYLRNQREPAIERRDPANVLGIGWRVYHDVAAAALDWRGIFRAKGAA